MSVSILILLSLHSSDGVHSPSFALPLLASNGTSANSPSPSVNKIPIDPILGDKKGSGKEKEIGGKEKSEVQNDNGK